MGPKVHLELFARLHPDLMETGLKVEASEVTGTR
jgi:hypothetical protein